MRWVAGVVLVLLALGAAGCGSAAAFEEDAAGFDGEALFKERCGTCHALAAAGTQGIPDAPDLDQAIDDVRSQGFDESTIREVVRGQISYPVSDPPTESLGMPPASELFENIDDVDGAADAVAIYVASVAGDPDAAPAPGPSGDVEPQELFAQSCGGCHTLSDAGTTGTIGPNLDQGGFTVEQAVEQIANGGGGMPAFEDQLDEGQIRELAEYLVAARP